MVAFPFIGTETKATPKVIDTSRTKNQYGYTDIVSERLWTPDEINEAGFVFVKFPTFVHDHNNHYKPIMKSYVNWSGNDPDFPLPNDNYHPIVNRTKMVSPWYIKDYDVDKGTRRGIHSIDDYNNKKDIFKPMIVEFMRKQEFHYVYEVTLGNSPIIWDDKYIKDLGTFHNYMLPVFVRGAKIPKKI